MLLVPIVLKSMTFLFEKLCLTVTLGSLKEMDDKRVHLTKSQHNETPVNDYETKITIEIEVADSYEKTKILTRNLPDCSKPNPNLVDNTGDLLRDKIKILAWEFNHDLINLLLTRLRDRIKIL